MVILKKTCTLSPEAIQDVCWWRDNILNSKNNILQDNHLLTLTTDASSYGWGAVTLVLVISLPAKNQQRISLSY